MPDRLKAGLQILVLTMLVRIQLGQQGNLSREAGGVFCFLGGPKTCFRDEKETKNHFLRSKKGFVGH